MHRREFVQATGTGAATLGVRGGLRDRNLTACVFICCALTSGCGKSASVSSIERVLAQDATTLNGATTIAAVVVNMRAIDTNGCPDDFRAAYLSHVHAWEIMADVEQEAIAYKANNESASAYAESLIRGFLGDPFGKANEVARAQNQLQGHVQAAQQQIRVSFQRVEEVAVARGANLPKKK